MKDPLNIINEHLINGYYDNLPPFTYSKDATTACYLLGYCSKIDYDVAKARYQQINSNKEYEQINSNKEYIRQLMII